MAAAVASSPLPVPYDVKRVSIGQRMGQRARAREASQSQCGFQKNGSERAEELPKRKR